MTADTHVVLTQSVDVALSIGRPGLMEARLAAVGSAAQVVREPAGRFDVLAQRLTAAGDVPEIEVPEHLRPWFAAQFETALGGSSVVLAILSVRDELTAEVWRHREHGFLVQPPPNVEMAWTEEQRTWLSQHFVAASQPTAQQSAELLAQIAGSTSDDAVLVVFNVSTYDPVGVRHDFTEDVYPILAHRLDLALEQSAAELGIAVIDVDRSVAEYGGAKAVVASATYSDEASAVIAEDALSAINQLGVDGLSLEGDVMRLDVPSYDRRTTHGRIEAWHIAPGTDVERGAPLFDLKFENLVHRLDYEAQETNRSMSLTVLAADAGRVASVDVPDGAEVLVGQTVGVVVKDESVVPVPIGDIDDGVPPFRIGIRVK